MSCSIPSVGSVVGHFPTSGFGLSPVPDSDMRFLRASAPTRHTITQALRVIH